MRILRGQSNRDVSASGFALFVVGIVLATFLGGAVRTLLRSEQVHNRVLAALKQKLPRQVFTIGRSELLLSRGIWPALGLKLSQFTVRQTTCDKLSFVLEVPELILPIEWTSLIRGGFRLGRVEIAQGRLHLDFKNCERSAVADSDRPVKEADIPRWVPTPGQFNWQEASRHVDGLLIRNLSISYEKIETWKLFVRSLNADFDHDFLAHAQVDVQKGLPFGTLSRTVNVEAESEDNLLRWTVQSAFKEGQVSWMGDWDLAHDMYLTRLKLHQVPVKDVMAELFQMGLIERDVPMKAAWISGSASWEGQVKKWNELPVKIRDCRFEGAYGQALIESADVFPWASEPIKSPLRLQVQRLQIQPVLEAMDRELLPAVFPRLGVWSGKIEFMNRQSWSLDGAFENIEVIFSHQSVRGKQLLNRVHTVASQLASQVRASIKDIELQDGRAAGQVDFHLSEDLRTGTFKLQLEDLALSPYIQKLLIGGLVQGLRVRGDGVLQNGELRRWAGEASVQEAQGSGWKIAGLKISSRFQPARFSIEAQADSVALEQQWPIFQEIKPLLAQASAQANWTALKSHVEIVGTGGQIHSFSAWESTGRQWQGKGSWVRDGQLSGVLMVKGGGSHSRSAEILGQNGVIQIVPK